MKTRIQSIRAFAVMALLLGATYNLNAQDQDKKAEESIKVKITTSENGQTKVFEKEYDSKAAMESDVELKEFKSEAHNLYDVDVHFDDKGSGPHMMRFFRNFDSDENGQNINIDVKGTDDGRIKLTIKEDKDGETKTIEKTYDSREEMKNDSELEVYNIKFLDHGAWMGDKGKARAFFFKKGNDTDFEIDLDGDSPHTSFFSKDKDGELEIKINGKTYTLEDLKNEDVIEQLKEDGQTMDVVMTDDNDAKVIIIKVKRTITISDFEKSELPEAFDKKSEGQLQLDGLQYFPNPSNGTFKLSFKSPARKNLKVRVVDMVGKEVYSHETSNFIGNFEKEIDLSSAQSGIYILQIQQGDKAISKKIVIE